MSENVFLRERDFYTREVNPISQYIEQMGFYLHKLSGKEISLCKTFIESGIRNKQFNKIKDPTIHYYQRADNGDRGKTETRLSGYIKDINSNSEVLVPTGTTYCNPNNRVSLLVDFIDNNVKIRSKAKKEAFTAEMSGNKDLFIMKNNEQTNMKLYNNSMSGAFATKGSMLNNPTAHNTLTSITRTVSSLGNATNEKLISGNRHYRSPQITLNNLISITSTLDKINIKTFMDNNNLYYPTVEDVIDCITYSSDLYWRDGRQLNEIQEFVNTLDEIERAGFVYIGDLYHIRKHNPYYIRNFLTKLSVKITDRVFEDPVKTIHSVDEAIVNFCHQICMKETKGLGKEYAKDYSAESLNILAGTCLNIQDITLEYKDLIFTFFLTKNIPASIAYIPNMVRRSVVLSDTDSTMFSVDDYVTWYFGELVFSDESFALAASIMYLTTQCIAHTLAIFSANINVKKEKLFNLAMKPEFTFPVFAQTSVAKHYYTNIAVKEGNVYKDPKMEIKGVHLKNSATPKAIIKPAHDKMKNILNSIMNNEKISLVKELKELADIERNIKTSVLNNKIEFFKQSKIKNQEAYSRSEEQSPYLYHLLWEEVFEGKYGKITPPPYSSIKIPTILDNITAINSWLESIEDIALKDRASKWLLKNNKKALPTIYISADYVKAFGIPKEIFPIINIKSIVLDLTLVNRIILESLGYFIKPEWLVSDLGY